ncbi:MAG: DUF4167 domain-containing protein [Hyphomonadaceae bacterium]|nr:DUF4167 domain-containing protein [Hyphomonadaceae bacterium]
MKHQQHHQRQRGRGRKPGGGGGGGGGGHNANRSFESTGPDMKVRGSASHIYEKYLQLARDANSSGDRVMAESYLQHAEHYFRIVRAMQPAQPPPQFEQRYDQRFGQEPEDDFGEDGDDAEAGADRQGADVAAEGEQPAHPQPYAPRERDRDRDRGPRPDGPRADGEGPREEGDDFRRNRRRRNRFRADGDAPARGDAEGGEFREDRRPLREPREEAVARDDDRVERAPREPREPRPPREPRRDSVEPVEGFADSPKPAFLAGE